MSTEKALEAERSLEKSESNLFPAMREALMKVLPQRVAVAYEYQECTNTYHGGGGSKIVGVYTTKEEAVQDLKRRYGWGSTALAELPREEVERLTFREGSQDLALLFPVDKQGSGIPPTAEEIIELRQGYVQTHHFEVAVLKTIDFVSILLSPNDRL